VLILLYVIAIAIGGASVWPMRWLFRDRWYLYLASVIAADVLIMEVLDNRLHNPPWLDSRRSFEQGTYTWYVRFLAWYLFAVMLASAAGLGASIASKWRHADDAD